MKEKVKLESVVKTDPETGAQYWSREYVTVYKADDQDHFNRDLPHWNQKGVLQYVTFRFADSLPQSKIDELSEIKKTI